MSPARVENRIQGAAWIPELFAIAQSVAIDEMTAGDVAVVRQCQASGLPSLGWLPAKRLADCRSHLGTLAARRLRSRYRLRQPERERLLSLLGGAAVLDARRLFVLATLIDEQFTNFAADFPEVFRHFPSAPVVPTPSAFLRDISNPAPNLGQMTPIAVCRRWWHRFWVAGRTDRIEGFGRLPEPRSVPLPSRAFLALEEAQDAGEFRAALVTWRLHVPADLQTVQPSPGCFAVTGYHRPTPPDLFDLVLDRCAAEQVHLALFPEIALTPNDLSVLISKLQQRGARFPTLIALGLTHVQRAGRFVNEAVVLDSEGEEVLRHEKLEPYTAPGLGLEAIGPRHSERYDYLDTPIGRLVVNICRDVRSDVPMILNRLLGVSLLLVPAYSGGLEFASEEARVLGARQSAITFSVNPTSVGLRSAACTYVPVWGTAASERTVAQTDLNPTLNATVAVVKIRSTSGVGLLDGPHLG